MLLLLLLCQLFDFGKAGTVSINFTGEGENQRLIVNKQKIRLEWNLNPEGAQYEKLWLHPKQKTGPMVTVKDWEGLLVITFPRGLKGPVVTKMFSDGSSAISATSAFTATDETGTTMVVEEVSEQGTPPLRIEYRWKNGTWTRR